jgi:hypothetical protein
MRAVPRLGYYRRPVVLNVEKGLLTLQKRSEQRGQYNTTRISQC